MGSNVIKLGPGYYPNPDVGRALSSGDIYIGEPDLDPEVPANQKTVSAQKEDGNIVAITQPIQTGAGGVPLYNGSPVILTVDGDYSMKVLDSIGSQIYYTPKSLENFGDKQDTITGAATTITDVDLAADGVCISDGTGKVAISPSTTSTQVEYLNTTTSNIQNQINTKPTGVVDQLANALVVFVVTTGTPVISYSYNVSSIFDNGVGDATVVYAVATTDGVAVSSGYKTGSVVNSSPAAATGAGVQIISRDSGSAAALDPDLCSVVVF